MNILDKKSESNKVFYFTRNVNDYNGSLSFGCLKWQNEYIIESQVDDLKDICTNKAIFNSSILSMLKIKPDILYTYDVLINTKLLPLYNSYWDVNRIREILAESNLINEYDRRYLNSIGFNPSHLKVLISDMGLNQREYGLLTRSGLSHLWHILLLSEKDISNLYNCGPVSIKNIKETIAKYGYSLNNDLDYNELPTEEVYTETEITNNINRILKSRKVYVSTVRKYLEKIEETDKELDDEIQKLRNLIHKNN